MNRQNVIRALDRLDEVSIQQIEALGQLEAHLHKAREELHAWIYKQRPHFEIGDIA